MFGSFVLAYFLIFTWITCLMFGRWRRPIVDRIILGLTAAPVALMFYGLVETYEFSHFLDLKEKGLLATPTDRELGFSPRLRFEIVEDSTDDAPWFEDPCDALPAYVGHWDVVSVYLSDPEESFPDRWIELRNDRSFIASNGILLPRVSGTWEPHNAGFTGGWIRGLNYAVARPDRECSRQKCFFPPDMSIPPYSGYETEITN